MSRGAHKYPIPPFMSDLGFTQNTYGTWLDRITIAHSVRDNSRLGTKVNREAYRTAIHDAVCRSNGRDAYTNEPLDFRLLEHFAGAPVVGRSEEETPTLDHVVLHPTKPVFAICSLRTNKCKADLTVPELIDFARKFLTFQKEI